MRTYEAIGLLAQEIKLRPIHSRFIGLYQNADSDSGMTPESGYRLKGPKL